jgi:ABC-2 type transport system permease protein
LTILLRDLFAYRNFIRNIVLKDLKLRYQASVLGFLWSLLNPLMMLAMYTVVFSTIMRVPTESNFTFFLFSGLMPWIFCSGSVMDPGAITGAPTSSRKVHFETLPVGAAIRATRPGALGRPTHPRGHAAHGWRPRGHCSRDSCFTVGLAFAISALTTVFRDVAHFTEVAIMLLFWATPIVYPPEMAPHALQVWFRASPLAGFTICYQDLLVHHRLPEVGLLSTLVLWTAAALLVGHAVFRRLGRSFAEAV